ncbi:MAG: hypothetical protein ABSB80_06330 [Methanoregula sp.]|jgi:hypothetical protein|uniref:hypothetical protein n=1 Tax=Methanoregula sp. TaxID=2052170 RepID=UPI003D0AE1DC
MGRKTKARDICEEMDRTGGEIDSKLARQAIKEGWIPKRPEYIKKYGRAGDRLGG